MGAGPRAVVTAPPAGAAAVGLLASAVRPDGGDGRWENGITYEPEGCYDGFIDNPCDSDVKDNPAPAATMVGDPYTLVATYRCSAMAAGGKDWEAIVRRRLAATEGWQLERELWTGIESQSEGLSNRWLADLAHVDILTEAGPVSLTHGLACLEQYLAGRNGGQQGMVHATPQVVTHWQGLNLLRRVGNRLLTTVDTVVVPGMGYTGGDPDGNAASTGDVWAYATDMVEVRLGAPMIVGRPDDPSFVDRTDNTATIRAERMALASWEGCRHGGVRLDVSICGIGGS